MIPSTLALAILDDPLVLFLCGLSLLVLFIWYFATESDRLKRNIGTILILGLCAMCATALYPPDKTLKGGIDIVGGSSFTLKVVPNVDPATGEAIPLRPDDMDEAVRVIEKRLNAFGTTDMQIAKLGSDSIQVQMPGMSPETADVIEDTLQQVAKLELKAVNIEGSGGVGSLAELVYKGEEIEPGFGGYKNERTNRDGETSIEYLLLDDRVAVDGSDVKDAYPQLQGAESIVAIELTGEGGEKMRALTEPMTPGRDRMAALLDDEVLVAPVLQAESLGRNFIISGQESLEESRALASALKNPLKNALKVDQKSTVSPTLGAAIVEQGVTAGLIGLVITGVFILVYYRTAGLIALVALLVNALIIFGAMAMFEFSFTLPGIAGIILTIGMAVDANVLIYERLREELDAGKSFNNAVNTAYEKAFSAIFDSNITSLLVAVILFWRASGTVQGFAVTLTVGLLGSMFSAILVTRVFFRWGHDLGMLKKVSLLNLFRSTQFDFLSKRRIAFGISSLLLLAAISGFALRQKQALGVDFTGGTQIKFQFQPDDPEITVAQVNDALKDLDTVANPVAQEEVIPGTGELLSVRCDSADAETIIETLRSSFEILGKRVPKVDATGADTGETTWAIQANQEAVSATAGKVFLENSLWAIGFGMLAILIYISIRFEFSFALGAIVAVVHDVVLATGLVVLFGGELSLIHVGAILTIAGYSVNDTIIVFDRIREALLTSTGKVKDLMNEAINATLSRTLLTSATTILSVAILALLGGSALRDFSVMILVGLVIGTYSSIFVAAPVVLWWSRRKGQSLRKEVLDTTLAAQADPTNG